MSAITQDNSVGKDLYLMATGSWFPAKGYEKIKKVALGIFVGLATQLALVSVAFFLIPARFFGAAGQDALKIFSLFQNAHPLIQSGWKSVYGLNIVLIAPVAEEILFRGLLNDKIDQFLGNIQPIIKKVIRIALVSLIFAVCHLSPFQNTFINVYTFGYTAVLGVVLSILKETQNDLTAPIAAHMVHNFSALMQL